ncbi:dUTP pyrophosphatase [Enteropsectra breve]|nr:dUTP pyrophosphatase [Enteropsectra breve]
MRLFKIKPLDPSIKLPQLTSDGRYIIYSNEEIILSKNTPYKIKTGFVMAFPVTFGAVITAYGSNIKIFPGIADSDFRGEFHVLAYCEQDVSVRKYDPIALINLIGIGLPEITELE